MSLRGSAPVFTLYPPESYFWCHNRMTYMLYETSAILLFPTIARVFLCLRSVKVYLIWSGTPGSSIYYVPAPPPGSVRMPHQPFFVPPPLSSGTLVPPSETLTLKASIAKQIEYYFRWVKSDLLVFGLIPIWGEYRYWFRIIHLIFSTSISCNPFVNIDSWAYNEFEWLWCLWVAVETQKYYQYVRMPLTP